eukprot:Seg596.8 transcript_id=Seg596.8/GoldUCD/mRNA.D3Y31 product="P2X purinoceptor 7" protein_id=Seg596.8/GoldUCD/D3Y31
MHEGDSLAQHEKQPDGHILMEREIELARKGVKDFVKSLDKEMLENLVVELSSSGSGSVSHLQDLVKVIQGEPASPTPENPELAWCICNVCVQMSSAEERKCCGKVRCLSSYHVFQKVCLDRDVLEVHIKAHADHYAENIEFTTNAFRKAAYRQFIMWRFGTWLRKSTCHTIMHCSYDKMCIPFT